MKNLKLTAVVFSLLLSSQCYAALRPKRTGRYFPATRELSANVSSLWPPRRGAQACRGSDNRIRLRRSRCLRRAEPSLDATAAT
jgi:hypothetical protein